MADRPEPPSEAPPQKRSRLTPEGEAPESRLFRKYYSKLYHAVLTPIELAVQLYSADVLSDDIRKKIEEIGSKSDKVSQLLTAVESAIKIDPKFLYSFLEVLEKKDSLLKHICDKMRNELGLPTSQPSLPPVSTSSDSQQPNNSMLPSTNEQSVLSPPLPIEMNNSSSSITYSSTAAITSRDKYKQFLKNLYQHQPLPDDDKLLKTASKHYIELAVITKKGITSNKQADEFTKKSLCGLTEEILHKNNVVELKDILKPREDGTPVRCVLVDGAPGIGKSTLAWEICRKWEELESVKQYELVVLVSLREKNQEAHCLGDLLPCNPATNINNLLAIIGEGEGLLFVLDGFDELPYEKRQRGSVYIDLLKSRLLPKATIIITSRPSVSADLWSLCQHNIHRHLEVIGFTKENIVRYAKSVFGAGRILDNFLSYITSNPPIYSMMYIPLNAVIVALIYQDSYDTDPFPKTMTDLFDALTRAVIRRHLVSTGQVDNKYRMPPSLQYTENINKLPPLIGEKLLQLAKLAYENLCEKTYVFNDIEEDFEHLGIMKKTTSLDVCTGPRCSYSFLYITLQEYFAAIYIAVANPSSLQLVDLLKLGGSVVRFLAGMFSVGYRSHPLYHEMKQTIASNPATISLDVLQWVYECPSIMENVMVDYSKHDTIRVLPEEKFDWYALGYCISHIPNIRWELGMDYYNMKENGVEFLIEGLGSCAVQHVFLECVSLSQAQLHKFHQLHCESLRLHCVSIDRDDEIALQQLMESGKLRKLEYTAGLEHTDTFIPLLFQQSSLQEVILNEVHTNIRTELLPKNNTNITKLVFKCNVLPLLAPFIPKITSLIYLEISDILDDRSLLDIIKIVQLHLTLEVLKLVSHKDRTDTPDTTNLLSLIEAANNNRQLRELRLECSDYEKIKNTPSIKQSYGHLLRPY